MNKTLPLIAMILLGLAPSLFSQQIFFEDFEGMGGNSVDRNGWMNYPIDSAYKVAPSGSQFSGVLVGLYFDSSASASTPSLQPYTTVTDDRGIGKHYPTTSGVGDTDFLATTGTLVSEGTHYELSFDYFMRPDMYAGQAFTAQLVDYNNTEDVLAAQSYTAPTVKGEITRAVIRYVGNSQDAEKTLGIRFLAPGNRNTETTGFDNVAVAIASGDGNYVSIPEPNSYSLLAGLLCLAQLMTRRRR